MLQEGSNLSTSFLPGDDFAIRKAEKAVERRKQAAEWLTKMNKSASECLSKEPSEKEFCSALRNGIILCNVLNKINPGAIPKIVDNSVLAVKSEGGAQSAIQYFENVMNFLVAVGNMKLLTFEASDLEKGGSSSKVVECILCMKGYYEWRQSGAVGVWRYGGTINIASSSDDSADEIVDIYDTSQHKRMSDFLQLFNKVSFEESREAKALGSLCYQYGLGILKAYLTKKICTENFSLNTMMIDVVVRKVHKDFSGALVSHGFQLGILLKKILRSEIMSLSNEELLDAISKYLSNQATSIHSDPSEFCICGGKAEINNSNLLSNEELYDAITQYLCKKDASECSNSFANYKEVVEDQQNQLEELKSSFLNIEQEVRKLQLAWDEEFRMLGNHINSLEVASSSYQKLLEENRQLYNQVQDLKGAIRVNCRVKPFSPEQSEKCSTIDHIGENGNIMILHPHKQGREARREFSFNKIFGPNMNQKQIYADIQPLIRSVLDGFNVCIFAYGQTGSGKTYTMSGPDLSAEGTWGVNYRALSDLFQMSKSREDLVKNSSPMNGINVPNASSVPVDCTQDVLELMRIGQKNRAVGATALNQRSSRSHSILTVHIQGKELISGTILKGCLHLVDLAGSERVDKSEAIGERLREAQHINKSLSALGDVISALAKKSAHIPYRNSKLTQVLQDSLGGQAKALMFVHINPERDAIGETISTLTFAERVASIELGAAKSNRETTEIRCLKEEISNLRLIIEKKESSTDMQASALKLESVQDSKLKSSSSRSQRKLQFHGVITDKETRTNIAELGDDTIVSSKKVTSQSPPIKRPLSADRVSFTGNRIKPEMALESRRKLHFPATVTPTISSSKNKTIAKENSSSRIS
ncbi:hypothetical protein V2J09_001646 [Rumex salicifolius]